MTSAVYQKHVGRSILVGPTSMQMSVDPEARLGEHGEVLYSSIDNIDRAGLAGKFRPVEWAFNVTIVYGKRRYFSEAGGGGTGEAEVLLIDVFRANPDRLNVFKLRLWETFGLDSSKYEKSWDYEEYVRLAEPAYYALLALLTPEELPCILFSHEFMGMPAALQAILDGEKHFRTVFHAHECATARRIVEDHPGHDTMFYNVLDQAREAGLYVDEVFGSMDGFFRHALVSRAYLCDGLIAVGDRTADEFKFLNQHFDDQPIDLVYNGVPAMKVDIKSKVASRRMLLDYSKQLLGHTPDVLLTHVTRPVISKGLWRDLMVCHWLDGLLSEKGKTAVLYILTTGGGARRPQDIAAMEKNYGWPRYHRKGFPDLVGPEEGIWHDAELFNAGHRAVQVVLVNQFGWSRARIGSAFAAGHGLRRSAPGHGRGIWHGDLRAIRHQPIGAAGQRGHLCDLQGLRLRGLRRARHQGQRHAQRDRGGLHPAGSWAVDRTASGHGPGRAGWNRALGGRRHCPANYGAVALDRSAARKADCFRAGLGGQDVLGRGDRKRVAAHVAAHYGRADGEQQPQPQDEMIGFADIDLTSTQR